MRFTELFILTAIPHALQTAFQDPQPNADHSSADSLKTICVRKTKQKAALAVEERWNVARKNANYNSKVSPHVPSRAILLPTRGWTHDR